MVNRKDSRDTESRVHKNYYPGRNWAGIATIVQVMTTFFKLDFLLDYKLDISKITANKIFDNSNCSFA